MIGRRAFIFNTLTLGVGTLTLGLSGCNRPSRVQSPLTTQEAERLCLQVLAEISRDQILPPMSQADARFPNLVQEKILRGELLVRMGPLPLSEGGIYTAATNTLTLNNNTTGMDSLSLRTTICHETYHAFQDIACLPLSRLSEIEGPAYLLQTKYQLHALGHRQMSQSATNGLRRLLINKKDWLSSFTSDQFSNIVAAALTQDRSIWNHQARVIGETRVQLQFLTDIIPMLYQAYEEDYSSGTLGPLALRLGDTNTIIMLNINLEQARNLIGRAANYNRATSSADIHRTSSDLFSYWLTEVFPSITSDENFHAYDSFHAGFGSLNGIEGCMN